MVEEVKITLMTSCWRLYMYNREPELHTAESGKMWAEGAEQEDVTQMHCGKCRILKCRVLTSALGTKSGYSLISCINFDLVFYEFPNFKEEQYKSSGVTLFTAAASLF